MPAALSHFLLAERLRKTEGIALQSSSIPAFLWGAQGPDFFYCHRFFPWQKGESLQKCGTWFHESAPCQLLETMRDYDKQSKDPLVHAYILGFLSHYTLDSVGHPFIRYGAHMLHTLVEPSTEDTCHHAVESMLDVILLRYERSALPTEIRLKKLVPKDMAVYRAIAGLYQNLIFLLYEKQMDLSMLEQCLRDCRTAFGWMTDRTTLKKQWVIRREKKKNKPPFLSCHIRSMTEEDEFDYANILRGEWQWPLGNGPVRTESFFELFDQAEKQSLSLIQAYEAGQPLVSFTQDRPF